MMKSRINMLAAALAGTGFARSLTGKIVKSHVGMYDATPQEKMAKAEAKRARRAARNISLIER